MRPLLFFFVTLVALSYGSHSDLVPCDNLNQCADPDTACRWVYVPPSDDDHGHTGLHRACYPKSMMAAPSVNESEALCGEDSAVSESILIEGLGKMLQPLTCNKTEICPIPSVCQVDFTNPEFSCCCMSSGDRKKRSIRSDPHPRKAPVKANSIRDCVRVFAVNRIKKAFDKEIDFVEIAQLFDYKSRCNRHSYSFEKNRFFVNGCRALFRICFVESGPETTPQLTTPTAETCRKEISLYGLDLTVDGVIESVEFKPLPHAPYGGYGRYGSRDQYCFKDVHYSFEGSRLTAEPSCVGIFVICYGPAPPTTPALTTTESVLICEKYFSSGSLEKTVPGVIVSVQLLKQVILGYHIHTKVCEEGVDYGYEGSRFFVTSCKGSFKVCWETRPQTTPRFETTEEPLKCRKLINNYGIRKEFRGDITKVTYIVLPQKGNNPSKYKCREGIDYHYRDSLFIASSSCKGLFKVCYKEFVSLQLTTISPAETCKQVYSKNNLVQKFDGRITTTELVRQIVHGHGGGAYGYGPYRSEISVCEGGKNYFVSGFDTFNVINCWALFKVCYEELPPTTTAAQFTTTPPTTEQPEPEEKCLKLQNIKGLEVDFDQTIKSVVFIEVKPGGPGGLGGPEDFIEDGYQEADFGDSLLNIVSIPGRKPHSSYGGFGDYGYGHAPPVVICEKDKDYTVTDSVLIASPKCQGFFQVCISTTPEQLTTQPPQEVRCEIIDVYGKMEKTFPGEVIQSVHVIKQFGYFHGRGYCAQGSGMELLDSTLVVNHCRGELKVCLVPEGPVVTPPLTTSPPVDTTTPEPKICKRLYNNYGINEYFSGDVTSVIYLQVKKNDESDLKGLGGYLDDIHSESPCHLGQGYWFEGRHFVATPYCPGFFQLCHKEDPVPFYTYG